MNKNTSKIPAFLMQKEVEKLTRNVRKDKHKLGMFLMYYAGLRISEVSNLRVSDIHLARGYMRILGKGNKERIVPINLKLQNHIENYLRKHGHKLNSDSYILGGDRSAWHRAVKKYSIINLGRTDVHCHTLRHSFAAVMYEKGVPIERISELLGHTSIDTTMIYNHISVKQKKEAVNSLDDTRSRVLSILKPLKKRVDITVKNYDKLVGREKELIEINNHIKDKVSVVLYGPKGCGKSAILKNIENSIYISEFRKKKTLIEIILSRHSIDNPEVHKEAARELKKLSIDELISEIKEINRVIVIDDITDLSKTDRKTISKLSKQSVVLTSTSRHSDKKLFKTYIDIKPLKRYYTRMILSDMIQLNNPQKKETIIDDILHQSGDNIKEAEYIANQLQLGKSTEEITSDERSSNQVSIAPVLLIFVLFFVAYVLKSYATSMVALSYALLVVFRLLFYRFLLVPSMRKSKQ